MENLEQQEETKTTPTVFKPIPGNVPEKITGDKTKASPYYFVGLLDLTFEKTVEIEDIDSGEIITTTEETNYIGTGTLIFEPGKTTTQYVLTCAHNLYDPAEGTATKVKFSRGQTTTAPAFQLSDPVKPYPTINATAWYVPDAYKNNAVSRHADFSHLSKELQAVNISYDYGLVKLAEAVDVSDLPQMVVKTDRELTGLAVQINGYGIYDTTMSHATGNLAAPAAGALFYPITTDKGASGSAIMMNDNKSVVGIHTRSVDGKNLNQGVQITEAVKTWINSKIAG